MGGIAELAATVATNTTAITLKAQAADLTVATIEGIPEAVEPRF